MSDNKLERRVEHLESEIQTLRKKLDELSRTKPWWDRIAGTFEKDPMYEQAMKLGRKYRRAQRG
jgi:prefoldin subunit 5